MGLFDGAKAQIDGRKALKTHVSGNRLANDGKPGEAEAAYRQAYALYERALEEGPQKTDVRMGFVVLLMRLGEFERAQAMMQEIRKAPGLKDDDWFEIRLNYAVCLWKTGKLDEAIDTIGRAAKIKKNAALYTTMGMFLVDKARETGDFEALRAFNAEAVDYDDEDAGTLDNLGATNEALREWAERSGDADAAEGYRKAAIECYEKAHEAKPRQITTIHALARLYHEAGDDDKAREVMEDIDTLYYGAVCPVSREMMTALAKEIG